MASVMEMPKLSDTMKEGVVAKWLKKVGDKVTAGAPVVEIETDKATMEFEAPASGILLKIIVGDAGTCGLNDPIAVIGKEGENWQEALDKYNAKKGAALVGKSDAKGSAAPKSAAPVAAQAQQAAPATSSVALAASSERVKASPLAKKIASDKSIDLKLVQGSGPGGRIVMKDLEGAVSSSSAQSFAPVSANTVEKIPLTNMRKTIAKRLTESVQQNPHFYLTVSLNMGNLLAWRKSTLATVTNDSSKFSVNDILVFLISRALKKHLDVNSSWQEDHVLRYHSVHMGIAVSLPGGLMTPVVRNADSKSLLQISQDAKALIAKARDGKLQPDDYAGGTFTISNLGMNGIEEFTAIINPPQAAILAVGATIPTPVVAKNGSIVVEERMKVTLSCDHRVIDGVAGSEFLKTLKRYVEDPMSALFLG